VRTIKCVCSNGLQGKLTYVCARNLRLLQSSDPLSDFPQIESSYVPTIPQTIPNVNDLIVDRRFQNSVWPLISLPDAMSSRERERLFSLFW
jgi:hypothetical protein